jgi:hypothetical protein
VAKKLNDIVIEVESQASLFRSYLEMALDKSVWDFINALSSKGEVFLFSGIIRNFFLKKYHIRDIDLVVDGIENLEDILIRYDFKKNSFGGYKLKIESRIIDIWFLNNTWGLNFQKKIEYQLDLLLPETAFFNFSSIVYSLNKNSFTVTNHFAKFIRDKKIDLVYAPNLNPELCVVNSLYYTDKIKYPLGKKLILHISNLHKQLRSQNKTYKAVQIKHFGEVLFTEEFIDSWVNGLIFNSNSKTKKKTSNTINPN